MNINIAQINVDTFWDSGVHSKVPPSDRKDGEELEEYLSRFLSSKSDFVIKKVKEVFDNGKPDGDYLFVTLPEFFWNAPWDALRNSSELGELVDFYMSNLSKTINDIMINFAPDDFGKIVLLAGSAGLPVAIDGKKYHESFNYLLTANNWRKNPEGEVELSMWPKRTTSSVDYGVSMNARYVDDVACYTFGLGKAGTIVVTWINKSVAEHNAITGYGPVFDNSFIPELPFSINLCLDYNEASSETRKDELDSTQSKIDFLIACGMNIDFNKQYSPGVLFSCRNDGNSLDTPSKTEVYSVDDGKIKQSQSPLKVIGDDIFLWRLSVI